MGWLSSSCMFCSIFFMRSRAFTSFFFGVEVQQLVEMGKTVGVEVALHTFVGKYQGNGGNTMSMLTKKIMISFAFIPFSISTFVRLCGYSVCCLAGCRWSLSCRGVGWLVCAQALARYIFFGNPQIQNQCAK